MIPKKVRGKIFSNKEFSICPPDLYLAQIWAKSTMCNTPGTFLCFESFQVMNELCSSDCGAKHAMCLITHFHQGNPIVVFKIEVRVQELLSWLN